MSALLASAGDWYVSTNGSDGNLGTIASPFATINKARDSARAEGTNVLRTINIRGGNYYNVGVLLQRESGSDDSGLVIRGYANETANLYGGMPLTNWTSISNGWWMATLPAFPSFSETNVNLFTNWQARMLLVDGVMADRSQYPTNTYSLFYTNNILDADRQTLKYTNSDLGIWLVPTNAEIQIDYSWDQETTGLSAIDTNLCTVTMYPTLRTDAGRALGYTGIRSYRIYNIAEGMTREGQFYYDRASSNIIYWPRAAKDPNTSECIVPTTTRLFLVNGRVNSRPWGITFSNLTMKVATVDLINEGDFGYLWDDMSLVHANYCDNLMFNNVVMGYTVGNAIGMEFSFSTNTILQNSVIEFCGGGGAAIRGGPCMISNNLFRSIGMISFQSPAVRVSKAGIVTHNDFIDIKEIGVGDAYMQACVISYNRFSNILNVLRDMGAFYCIYGQTNLVTSNLFENIGYGFQGTGSDPRDYYRNAIYFDETTSNSVASYNICINTKDPYFMNAAHSNAVLNNVFINTNGEYLRLYASPGSTLPNNLYKNVFYCSTNILVDNSTNWNTFASNVFWSSYSPPLTNNVPPDATISDPLFNNIGAMDFGYQGGSPCLSLGIETLFTNNIGRWAYGQSPSIRLGNIKTIKASTLISP